MNFGEKNGLRTWIEIDKKAIKHNYQVLRKSMSPKCLLMAVVKSNAYGHSLLDFSKNISALGVDWFGVDSVTEAIPLRKAGTKKPILILGYTLPAMMQKAVSNDISLTISSFESLKVLEKINGKLKIKIHIKVDTGMHRQGFLQKDLIQVIEILKKLSKKKSNLVVEGLFTHFASGKDPKNPTFTIDQLKEFEKWRIAFKDAGWKPIVHASASAGTLLFPEAHFDMVRLGISLYGIWPSEEVRLGVESKISLKPILSWKTLISEIKTVPAGSKIGYDCTETLDKETQIANCPIGYWHGFPRALSSVGYVLVKGKKCKVLGRVSMDMITIDVGDVQNLKVGEEVVVLGKQGREDVTAHDMAILAGTSSYEIITRINPLIKRSYI
ncbi:MAG: alanine racemase [Patescibacteria group bacterium]